MIALLMLGAALLLGLVLIPLGLPGLWLMVGATVVYWLAVPGGAIGVATVVIVSALAVTAEVLEFVITGRFARRYGGSQRAAYGAIGGGLVGALLGVPIPIVGSMVGAFAGAFVGALVAELTVARDKRAEPFRVATGALLGRAAAAAIKTGIGVGIAAWIVAAAAMGSTPG